MRAIIPIVGVVLVLLGVILFWAAFFKLSPALVHAIPQSDWKPLLSVLCTIFVAYIGGIGIPLSFVTSGFLIFISALATK